MKDFKKFRKDILHLLIEKDVCAPGLANAINANTFEALAEVGCGCFTWCCDKGIITSDIIAQYREDFRGVHIHLNEDVTDGYVFVNGNNKVTVRGCSECFSCESGVIYAYNSSLLHTNNNSMSYLFGESLLYANDNSMAVAFDYSQAYAKNNSRLFLRDNSRGYGCDNSIITSFDDSKAVTLDGGTIIKSKYHNDEKAI
jgi:hypothetical protein